VLQGKCNAHVGMLDLEQRYYLVKIRAKHNPTLVVGLFKDRIKYLSINNYYE